ncbi:hypothetical protein ACTJJ0_31375 [Chitinophaga sp. 22321]|uniref:Uncharacterized protein n=1 Tax=Chitinophaga hostae TaxID=2831022 RepID=A0ABS5JB96_9BACT|nr:hypothetical protein [Chitinophaga hostae]MBS0031862.1 hypothetical protein [Chitinophaga hostae]
MKKQNDLLKRILQPGLATLFLVAATTCIQAQALLPDQNPRYRESMNAYLFKADSLTRNEGTTLQQTYHAYQYFEAKQALKEQRRQWRQDRRMARSSYWNDYTYNDYAVGYNRPYGYSYPTYGHYPGGFRWNDIATVTSLALGAYILFR